MSKENGFKVVGKASSEDLEKLAGFRQQAQSLVYQVGELELRKQRVMGQIVDTEDSAQGLMTEIAQKVGLGVGVPFQITKDGDVLTPEV